MGYGNLAIRIILKNGIRQVGDVLADEKQLPLKSFEEGDLEVLASGFSRIEFEGGFYKKTEECIYSKGREAWGTIEYKNERFSSC